MRSALAPLVATALALAGCVTPPETEAALAGGDGAATVVEPATVPLALEGSTYTGVLVCPVVTCVVRTLPAPEPPAAWFELDFDGVLRQLDVTLAWDARSPASEELRVGLSYENADGEIEWHEATGRSPLSLAVADLAVTTDAAPALYVSGFQCEAADSVCLSVQERFTLEGALTTTSG